MKVSSDIDMSMLCSSEKLLRNRLLILTYICSYLITQEYLNSLTCGMGKLSKYSQCSSFPTISHFDLCKSHGLKV